MKRYFIEISYNGTDFFGWQRQVNAHSVQGEIENALSKIYGNLPIGITGCGRTDAGVHAKQFYFHVDLELKSTESDLQFKLNRMLPESIAIHRVFEVKPDFHARFHAQLRTYRYFIHQMKNPFNFHQSWHVVQNLDYQKMNLAAELLLGTKDFTSFSKLHTDVKTNICKVTHAQWQRVDNGVYFEISADRFLRNMVRAVVGTLVEVGLGKMEVGAIQTILDDKNRQSAAQSVPAHGLFLWKVDYDWSNHQY